MSEKMIACNLDFEEISKLADKVERGSLAKIKIKNGDCEIVIEKECKMPPPHNLPPMPPQMAVPSASAPAAPAAPAEEALAPSDDEESGNVVKSPIVGTYYSAPAPDKAPFVEVGKQVRKGDVIMIIESMKLMNEVKSEFDGTVRKILVENGSAVEYDQPVMIIG
ncbi:MAG: acetyl-CoA carboxylase biotin carboxyl carrier protein [Porcipelethomonas sp.]